MASTTPVSPYVYIELDRHRRLRYRHQDLRDVVATTNKSVLELVGDPFFGWAHLLQHGLRFEDHKVTLNKASELIDLWLENGNTLDGLGEKLMEAMERSGFIKIERMKADAADEATPAAGNAQS